MFISYDIMVSNLKKYSAEKLNNMVMASNVKSTLRYILSIIILYFVLAVITRNYVITMIIYIAYVIVISVILGNRKVGIGINDNMLFLEYYKMFSFQPKKIFDVPYNKIKYITVHKVGKVCYLKVSFISSEKRFEQLKIMISSNLIGSGRKKQKENFKEVYSKLKEVEKIIDKGDF